MSTSEEQLGDVTEMSFGARLRAEREAREISLDAVAQQLNLHPRTVEALESEQRDQLPPPAFVRGYLRSYGRLLGIDGDALVREYGQHGSDDPAPSSMSQRAEQPRSSHPVMRWATVVIILLLAGLLVAWLLTRNGGDVETPSDEGVSQQESSSLLVPSQPVAESVTPSDDDAGSASNTLVVSTGEPDSDDESLEAAAVPESAAVETTQEDQPVEPAAVEETPASNASSAPTSDATASVVESEAERDEPVVAEPAVSEEPEPEQTVDAVIVPLIEDSVETAAEEIAPVAVPVASNGTDILELRSGEDSWAEITDSEGERLMFDLLRGGEPRRLIGVAPFRVFLGNAPPVELKINGLAVSPAKISSRNTARFSVSADGSQQ